MLLFASARYCLPPDLPMTADVPTLMLMIVVSSVAMAAALLVLGWGNWRDGLHYWAGSLGKRASHRTPHRALPSSWSSTLPGTSSARTGKTSL